MSNKPSSKPIHKIRDGTIEVSIWKNEGANGPWYSVNHRRSYKQGEEWKESDSYGQDVSNNPDGHHCFSVMRTSL